MPEEEKIIEYEIFVKFRDQGKGEDPIYFRSVPNKAVLLEALDTILKWPVAEAIKEIVIDLVEVEE